MLFRSLDIRQIESHGIARYTEAVLSSELSDSFWTNLLPQLMETSSVQSPYFVAFKAAQVSLGDRGFLSSNIRVRDLLLNQGDHHHIFPRKYLQRLGMSRGRYNQIANFVVTQSEINIAIGDTPPDVYFKELWAQVNGGPKKYGGITDPEDLKHNLEENCIPLSVLEGNVPDYDVFLAERRRLMALRIKRWYEQL